jgi:hypothetical protein
VFKQTTISIVCKGSSEQHSQGQAAVCSVRKDRQLSAVFTQTTISSVFKGTNEQHSQRQTTVSSVHYRQTISKVHKDRHMLGVLIEKCCSELLNASVYQY